MSLFKVLLVPVLAFQIVGCSTSEKQKEIQSNAEYQNQRKALAGFEAANAMFDSGDYEAAAKAYDKIVTDAPVSTLDGLIVYNSGIAHLNTRNCKTASEKFRQLIRFTRKRKSESLELRGKLGLSDSYSCLGDSTKSMVMLVEVFKVRKKLPPAVGLAEVPAKLAAAYSRIGNKKMSTYYFNIANRGLNYLEKQSKDMEGHKNLMAKTLFSMGDLTQVQFESDNYLGYYRTLEAQQKYLLKAATYQIKPWSDRAVSQIIAAYDHTWDLVRNIKRPKDLNSVRGGRVVKQKKGKILQKALESIVELENEKLPGSKNKSVIDLFSQLSKRKAKIRNFLVAEVPGSELTEEAKKLLNPRREGRVKSGRTVLEKTNK